MQSHSVKYTTKWLKSFAIEVMDLQESVNVLYTYRPRKPQNVLFLGISSSRPPAFASLELGEMHLTFRHYASLRLKRGCGGRETPRKHRQTSLNNYSCGMVLRNSPSYDSVVVNVAYEVEPPVVKRAKVKVVCDR